MIDFFDYGGHLEVDGQYVGNFEVNASPASQALFDSTTPTQRLRFTSIAQPSGEPINCQLVLVSDAGETKHRLALHVGAPTAGARGARVVACDSTGTFHVEITADRPERGGAVATTLGIRGIAGKFPYTTRPALDIFTHAQQGDRLEVRLSERSVGDATNMADFLAEARACADVVAALDHIQGHTGVLFPIPDDLTRHQAQELIFAARLLTGQPVRTEHTSMTFTIRADRVASFLELDAARIAGGILIQTRPYTVTCGTHDLDMGPYEVKAPRMHLANIDELYAAVGTGVEPTARYECIEGEGIYVQLTAARPDPGVRPG